jgi:hypothetical protein
MLFGMIRPFLVVENEKINPDGSAEAHYGRHERQEEKARENQHPHQIQMKYKVSQSQKGNGNSHGDGITHIGGTQVKPIFHLEVLSANGTAIGYGRNVFQVISVFGNKQIALIASGTFILRHAV